MDEETADVHIVLASTKASSYMNEKSSEIDIDSEEYLKDQQFSTVADQKFQNDHYAQAPVVLIRGENPPRHYQQWGGGGNQIRSN